MIKFFTISIMALIQYYFLCIAVQADYYAVGTCMEACSRSQTRGYTNCHRTYRSGGERRRCAQEEVDPAYKACMNYCNTLN